MGYRRKTWAFVLLALALGALMPGCNSDECGLDCRRAEPTIENIWPNEDGTFWSYEYTWRTWDADVSIFPDRDSLPPVPSLDEIENILDRHPIGLEADTVEGTYRLEFDGLTTTGSGVTAQNLEETVVAGIVSSRAPGSARGFTGFVERLRRARPDLRAEIGALFPARTLALQPDEPPAPIMVHGGAWEKTADWIGTYGDIDTLLAWKFLDADFTEGHEFTHQLVPSVASDVFLHCRVLGRTVVRSPGGQVWGAIEFLYILDYGPYELPGPPGMTGWEQFFDYGRVLYVPEIGPVSSYERTLISVGETIGAGYGDIRIELGHTSLDGD